MSQKILHVVHCIDTEGPLTEDITATFTRLENIFGLKVEPTEDNLEKLQNKAIYLNGNEESVAKVVSKSLLKYNNSWADIDEMLEEAMSDKFRNNWTDDFGNGWVYSWHCMDHAGYTDNPRRKDLGFGNVFRFYKQKLFETNNITDELNWHFHPLSFSRNPLQCATSYLNSYDVLLDILCRRLIDEEWYPIANRPGFHTERPDSHSFLEQWIPFDFANQFYEIDDGQPDLVKGRFGDWRRASNTWVGYQPSHDDYQVEGGCRRWIFRCLNVGTRFNELKSHHVKQAFEEANSKGSAILSFANHDYRDIRPDVDYVRDMIKKTSDEYPEVNVKFSGAVEAARMHISKGKEEKGEDIKISVEIDNNQLEVKVVCGQLFGPQPFLSIKSKTGSYFHDNFDLQVPSKHFTYIFDEQTLPLSQIDKIGVGAAGVDGSSVVIVKEIKA